MSDSINTPAHKRKVLSLPREPRAQAISDSKSIPPRFIERAHCWFMVWHEGGEMPKKLYSPEEMIKALAHAKMLARETGERFHVMRSWRAFEPEAVEE